MQHGEQSGAKKAAAWVVSPNGQVKREKAVEAARGEGAAAAAGAGEEEEEVQAGGMIAAAVGDGFEGVEISVRIDLAVLHCPLCLLPLKPPTYQVPAVRPIHHLFFFLLSIREVLG